MLKVSQVGYRGITTEELVEPRPADADWDYTGIVAGVSPVRVGSLRGGEQKIGVMILRGV